EIVLPLDALRLLRLERPKSHADFYFAFVAFVFMLLDLAIMLLDLAKTVLDRANEMLAFRHYNRRSLVHDAGPSRGNCSKKFCKSVSRTTVRRPILRAGNFPSLISR